MVFAVDLALIVGYLYAYPVSTLELVEDLSKDALPAGFMFLEDNLAVSEPPGIDAN